MDNNKLTVGFVTTVSGRWPLQLPNERNTEYSKLLTSSFPDVGFVCREELSVNPDDAAEAADTFKKSGVDLVIMLIGAFTGDNICTYLGEKLGVPVIIWAVKEPPFTGGRLMANALVSATMNNAAMHRLGFKRHFVYGDFSDARVAEEIGRYLRVYGVIKKLNNSYMGLIGYRPTAFYSSTFDETLIRRRFGIKMEEFDLKTIFDLMADVDAEAVKKDSEAIVGEVKNIELPEGHLENHSRLYLTLKDFVKKQGFNVATLKCWPEMGTLHTTPCAAISRLADDGFLMGCESDIDATITMLVQKYLTGQPTFMADLINIDEDANSVLFWHCGQAPRALKDSAAEIKMANHPLAGQGAAFETTLMPGDVTVALFTKNDGDYKLLLANGKAVPTEKVTKGVMVNVVMEEPVRDMIYKIAEEGVPHHYAIVWRDIRDDMKLLAKMLGIEVI